MRHAGLHGLIFNCILSQASSCGKLSCMIDAEHVAVGHELDSIHLVDEVVTSPCRSALTRTCSVSFKSEVCVESYVTSV